MPKRNAPGAGTIRKRPNGSWEARFTVGRDPGTGKQIQKSVYGRTQKEVRQKLSKATASIDAGIYKEPSRLTFGEWLDIWTENYCLNVKPRTLQSYKSSCAYRIKPALGAVQLKKLKPPIIQKFINDGLQGNLAGRKGSLKNRRSDDSAALVPLSEKTMRNLYGVIHKALEQAVAVGYIPVNPASGCTLPRKTKPEINPLDEQQTRDFLQVIQEDDYELVFKVDLFTGLREGEIIGLPWDAVDFETGTIRIYQQLQNQGKAGFHFAPPKNSKERIITPAPFVMELLRQQRAIQNQWKLIAGSAWENSGLVFTNQLGGHLYGATIYRHLKEAAAAIGYPTLRFHDLRHTYAVASIRAGDDIKTISENLGHATVAFTLDVYAHVTADMRKSSAQRMQNYINRICATK
ncbi:MAG: site-specific integrase [Ruminococcaceae bacterium]|nr:site-specific integrase [Oscillospiraceae bacterium]